jgi:hypothetical protein
MPLLQWQLQEQGMPGGHDAPTVVVTCAVLPIRKAFFINSIGGINGGAGGKSSTVRESVIGLEW